MGKWFKNHKRKVISFIWYSRGGGCPPYHLNNFGRSLRTGETNNCLYNVIMFMVWFAPLYCTGSLAGLRVLMHRRSLFFIYFFCNNYILPSSICFLFIQYTKAMFFKIDLRISNLSSIVTPNLSYKNKQSLTKMEQYSEIRVFLVCMFKSKKNKND